MNNTKPNPTVSLCGEISARSPQEKWKQIVVRRDKKTFYAAGHVPIGKTIQHTLKLRLKKDIQRFESNFIESGVENAITAMRKYKIIRKTDKLSIIDTTDKDYIHTRKWTSLFKKNDLLFFHRNLRENEYNGGYGRLYQLAVYTQDDDGSLFANVHYRTSDGNEVNATIPLSDISSPAVVTNTSLMRDWATSMACIQSRHRWEKIANDLQKKHDTLQKKYDNLLLSDILDKKVITLLGR